MEDAAELARWQQEFNNTMKKLTPELRQSVESLITSVKKGSVNTNRLNESTSSIATNANKISSSLGVAYDGILGFIQRTQKEATTPLEVGIDAIRTALDTSGKTLELWSKDTKNTSGQLGTVWNEVSKAISGWGKEISGLGSTAIGIAADAFNVMADQLLMTNDAFKTVMRSGVVLGEGLTGLARESSAAGVPIKAFARGLQLARQDMVNMGGGSAQATKAIGGVMNTLISGTEGYSEQLGALGYTTEEQMALIAQNLANDRAAGVTKRKNDQELARETLELGKNMRILQDITGKDAKAAMEKARVQAMEADLLAKAEAEGGIEGRKKLQEQLARIDLASPEMKKGYLEFVSTGGQAIADAATNVAIQQNPQILEFYKQQYSILGQGNVNASAAADLALKGLEQVGQAAKENIGAASQIGMGARLTGDALLAGASAINNSIIRMSTMLTEGTTDAATKNAEKVAARTDEALKAVESISKLGQAIQRNTQDILNVPLTEFAQGVNKATSIIQTFSEAMRKNIPSATQSPNITTSDLPKVPPRTEAKQDTNSSTLPKVPPGTEAKQDTNSSTLPRVPPHRESMQSEAKPRERGGPVDKNLPYIVGEGGPELLVPKSKATILPNEMLKGLDEIKNLGSVSKIMETAISDNSVLKKQFEMMSNQLMNPRNTDTYQPEMLSLLRQLVMTNSEVKAASSEMVAIMEDILSVQSRMANA